jgi:hypothetical protein
MYADDTGEKGRAKVKKEEPRAIISVSTMIPWEGPSVNAFWRLSIQRNAGRSAKNKNRA